MAALGKIRSKGVLLICIISLGLFAFIAEEAFRSCESSSNDARQQVGEVLGEKINVTEFQKLVDEYTEVIKMQQGQDNLNEDQLNQVKDMVWNTYVQTKLIENETKKLGLTVTDAELQNVLTEGTNPMLMQTPFVNQQTGRFDVNALKKFLAEYKAQGQANPQLAKQYDTIYKYWTFIEKTLRQQLLAQKYQGLFAHCFLSNKVEAQMAFNDQNQESQIQLAALSYSSIDDNKVQISDADLKAKYAEVKGRFKQYVESRDIKYVDVQVKASAADRAALQKEFAGYSQALASATDASDVVRKSTSLVNYLGVPVSKDAYPYDIAQRLDSMAVGSTSKVFENNSDNTLNVIKLVSKQLLPDSVQYRQIQVAGATAEESAKRADSIYNALKAGADFEVIAKKYGQTGEKTWLTTRQYQSAPSLDHNTKDYIMSLNTMSVNELKNVALSQGNLIVQVVDRKGMINKYVAAVVKKNVTFSKDTYSAAYNKFSSFVSANLTADAIVKNAAKAGFNVQERKDVTTAEHNLAGIRSTRDAMRWLFDAKKGDVSPLYECGDNDHLLVVVLDNINNVGYRSLDDAQVKEYVKGEVLKDKKAEMLMAKLNGVKSVAAAKAKGANVSTVNQVTFAAPVFVPATGASEPALSGAVAATAKGKFCKLPVKGNAGVYVFEVTNKTQRPGKFDAATEMQKLRQKEMQMAGNFMNELYIKAKVVDNRYLFF
ncbi:SurA N-terminal domain-containing protein [uncultured Prevotella sp.]|mgnify:FL=1|uniref:peptidylprolyl isomerase n=1 Tax=uncultured Prevotella sp. TaxID=159272 RepID=UPI0027E289D7|nr:SurA N-terminal domain-containing protein [uncultured Prevotella sp.]